ncbi:hypothetical protein ES705_17219 [subsurface metagenome]
MGEKEKSRRHFFEFPGKTGAFSIELQDGCFPDVDDDELYNIGRVISDFLSGILLESPDIRDNHLSIFKSVLNDAAISLEDKDVDALLQYSNKAFYNGDYNNSLFLSKLILARINTIIDKKIANNDRLVDKEIIHLQISTLNFIGYLFSKMKKNIDYGLKLTNIANTLLNEFDENSDETISLRSAILDTLGALYILKNDWDNAIKNLTSAHKYDRLLLSHGQIDEISYRLTCSNMGYALVQKCISSIDNETGSLNVHEIEENLSKAYRYFMMVQVDKSPVVPENHLKNRELIAAIKLMKKGLSIGEDVKKKLQQRLI